jgi:hypothetical protein
LFPNHITYKFVQKLKQNKIATLSLQPSKRNQSNAHI